MVELWVDHEVEQLEKLEVELWVDHEAEQVETQAVEVAE